MKVQNPVLRGFHPDPSLVRGADGYYIATSTFEWFPGVRIFYSKDMANWELVTHALTDDSVLDMAGMDTACGIWAPNLTYCAGTYYLMYTLVYTNRSRFKDTWNYLMTAKDVRGPWSKPKFINCSGFDPSLFHDTDGKKYVVNMTMDYRPDKERFSGIDIQEYDEKAEKLIGKPVRVYRGSCRGFTEGPNVLKYNGKYYLTCAEGGTEFGHCSVILRADQIWGPYEECPHNPIISSHGKDCLLQRAGHMQLMEDMDGNWYMAHLCSRTLDGFSIMGRETAIQNVEWRKDGWPKLSANEKADPEEYFDVPNADVKLRRREWKYDFKNGEIPLDFLTLRKSFESNGLIVENGKLHMKGGCSLLSKYHQCMLARTQENLDCDFEVVMEFNPKHKGHLAGLVVYYNYDNMYHLRITRDEKGKKAEVCSVVNREMTCSEPVYLPENSTKYRLLSKIRHIEVRFYLECLGMQKEIFDEMQLQQVGTCYDMRNISDEHVAGNGFTGAMLGVCCIDVQGDGICADISEMAYQEE